MEHEVNFISFRWTCSLCSDLDRNDELSFCEICRSERQKDEDDLITEIEFERLKTWSSYNSDNPIEDFVSWLLTAFSNKFSVIIFSHNGGR